MIIESPELAEDPFTTTAEVTTTPGEVGMPATAPAAIPVNTTPVPVNTTPIPVNTTPVPVNTTPVPVDTTPVLVPSTP